MNFATWSDQQTARLELLASDSLGKHKSHRYDRRRFNGSRTFGRLEAERRRALTLQNESARKSMEAEQQEADEYAKALIAELRERSRLRYGY